MGVERRLLRRATAVIAAVALAATAMAASAPSVEAASAGAPWWTRVAFAGVTVTSVSVDAAGDVRAVAGGRAYVSPPGGHAFTSAASRTPTTAPRCPGGGRATAAVTGGGRTWALCGGRVYGAAPDGALRPDPGAPSLPADADAIAAPAASPGVVLVAAGGTVWRRSPAGSWARCLVLLPTTIAGRTPRVTGLAAFTTTASAAVYAATDGYATLLTTDGGDDWIRAGPGLPGTVLAVVASGADRSVYAATNDGLWVHRLTAIPAPPRYTDAALWARQVGTALVTLLACALAVAALALVRRRPAGAKG